MTFLTWNRPRTEIPASLIAFQRLFPDDAPAPGGSSPSDGRTASGVPPAATTAGGS